MKRYVLFDGKIEGFYSRSFRDSSGELRDIYSKHINKAAVFSKGSAEMSKEENDKLVEVRVDISLV